MTLYNIDPRDFGIVGDGQTDNSDNLIAMRDFMLRDDEARWTVTFPHGHYLYSNNRWLRNVEYVEIVGNGARFECISTAPSGRDHKPLLLTSLTEDYGDTDYPGDPSGALKSGYRIEGADIGETKVKLLDPADAAHFTPGQWLCVGGFVQQYGGFPQNLRFFEYHPIESVAGNQITITGALRFRYDPRWYDLTTALYTTGKPRVFPLKRTLSSVAQRLIFRDMEFLPNTQPNAVSNNLAFSGLDVDVYDLKTTMKVTVATCRKFSMTNCMIGDIELDKLIELAVLNDVRSNNEINSAIGVLDLRLVNCITDSIIRCSPQRSLLVDQCAVLNSVGVPGQTESFYSGVQHYYNISTTRSVSIHQSSVAKGNFVYSSGAPYSLVVSDLDSSGNILIDDDTDGRRNVVTIQMGTKMFIDVNMTTELNPVEDMYFDEVENKHVLEGDFASITVGQTIYYDAWSSVQSQQNELGFEDG